MNEIFPEWNKLLQMKQGGIFMKEFITGNSFPMGLIRREVSIQPVTLEEYKDCLAKGVWGSYWGHKDTLKAVSDWCGFDLTPSEERPALTLDEHNYPALFGKSYSECWVVSPEYPAGFRPALGAEVAGDKILAWHILRIQWV